MNSLKPMLLTSLKSYDRTQFVKDVTAGIIVAIIALPLSIALALASGVDRKPESSRPSLRDLLSLHLVEAVYRLPDRPLHLQPSLRVLSPKTDWTGS